MSSQRSSQRAAVANRAPTSLLAGLTTRRTSQQVAADAKAAGEAARKAAATANANQTQILKTISRLEDDVRREELQRKRISARPDLHEKTPSAVKKAPRSSKAAAQKGTKIDSGDDDDNLELLPKPVARPRPRLIKPQVQKAKINGDKHNDFNQEPPPKPVTQPQPDLSVETQHQVNFGDDDFDHDAYRDNEARFLLDDESDSGPVDYGDVDQSTPELPAESSVYDESGSDGFTLGGDEDPSDGDHEDDSDFKDEGNDEEDESSEGEPDEEVASKKKTVKPKKLTKAEKAAQFRKDVDGHRKTTAPSALTQSTLNKLKRQPDGDLGDFRSKKHKHEAPSGLLQSFKRSSKAPKAPKPTPQPNSDVELEYNNGEYDKDEEEQALVSVRKSKGSSSTNGNTMSVSIIENTSTRNGRPSSSTNGRNFSKAECTWANMPFDGLHAARSKAAWRSVMKPTLAAWAASLDNPFSVVMDINTEVKTLWKLVLDDLSPLEPGDLRFEIVEGVACAHLYLWRSEIGRAALHVVVGTLRLELKDELDAGDGIAAGQRAAKFLLNGCRFLYGNPQAKGESARPFENPLIVGTYYTHLRHVKNCLKKDKYPLGHPIGAVGLCAAAVERALKLVRDGFIPIDVFPPVTVPPQEASDRGTGRRRKSTVAAFTEKAWGWPTTRYVEAAKKLTDKHWTSFLELAKSITSDALEPESDNEGSSGESDTDLRSNIRL